jgi:hypothetical protein
LFVMGLSWRPAGSGLWRGFDVRGRLVAEVVSFDDWHEELVDGTRAVVVDGRYWVAYVYEELVDARFAGAQEAMQHVDHAVTPGS